MGYERIFHVPELARLRWQVPVHTQYGTAYLDLFDAGTRVNIELDGAKYHAGPEDRERDLRRDAGVGRPRHHRGAVHPRPSRARPDEVRDQVRAILDARR